MNPKVSDQPSISIEGRGRLWRYRTQARWIIAILLVVGIIIPLSQIAFAAVGLTALQCNDNATPTSTCSWTNGMISGNTYTEGSAMPQYSFITNAQDANAPGHVYTYTWDMSWSDSQLYHGYDWIVSYEQAKQLHQDYVGTPLNIRPCYLTNNTEDPTCIAVRNAYSATITMPSDSYVSGIKIGSGSTATRIAAFEAKYGARTMTLYANAPFTGTPTINLIHVRDETNFPVCADNCDSVYAKTMIRYNLTYTSSATSVLLEYAGHFAIGGNPTADPMAWGYDITNKSYGAAGQYPAGMWHVKDHDFTGTTFGSLDNQARVGNPNAYPIDSSSSYVGTGTYATDYVTMTHLSTWADIPGTVAFYVCAEKTTGALSAGCPGVSSTADYTVTFVGTRTLTVHTNGPNKDSSTASSLPYGPPYAGHYCFLTIYTPAVTAISNTFPYQPTSDTNGYAECFDATGHTPTAIRLSKFTSEFVDNTPTFDGFPVVGLVVGLLGIVAVAGILVLGYKRR